MVGVVLPFDIDPDIRRARTPPPWMYTDPECYAVQRERVFAPSWQWCPEASLARADGDTAPFTLLPGCLDEPLVVTRDGERVRALSNVCTHRGHLVPRCAENVAALRCRYHGRRFGLDGGFRAMPEFEGVVGFPSADDDLKEVSLARWRNLDMVSLAPGVPLAEMFAELDARVSPLGMERLYRRAEWDRDYELAANWALYVDNYLEGFHVPFVHDSLAEAVDYGSYRTDVMPHAVLQTGYARRSEDPCIALPEGHRDYGQRVAGYYGWVFPNTMVNVYPWGLSLNVVQPVGVHRTRVLFRAWATGRITAREGAGADLHQVEMEDEAVVEAVQRGMTSRLAKRGRYSPTRETGVHGFHRMLAEAMGAIGGERKRGVG